jgi:uncharacterized phage-associated protein
VYAESILGLEHMGAIPLATWVLQHHTSPLTHLALQKLVFYGYGAVLAFDQESAVGPVQFEAWKHGPVNRRLWHLCRESGRDVIPVSALGAAPSFERSVECTLDDVLAVYGALDAWSLREQSHLEKPWREAYEPDRGVCLDTAVLNAHFKALLAGPRVTPPEYFLNAGTVTLDSVPQPVFESFHELAEAARGARLRADVA